MKIKSLFAFLLATLVWSACDNDFEVSAPWKDIPIVYGLLSSSGPVHYIRVEKAFLDPDANALELAQNPDSLYYDNLLVQFERVESGELFTLERVNGTDVGLPRDPGVFATEPNWLYKIDSAVIKLREGETIRLLIDRGNGLPVVTAETAVQGPLVLRQPLSNNFDFRENITTKLGWSASEQATIFDAALTIHYAEFPKDDPGAVVEKSFEWRWAKGLRFETLTPQLNIEKDGLEFFEVMASNIPEKPNFNRLFIGIDMDLVAGGEELEKYINVTLANSGITGAQEIPTFTNLSEGEGVFSTISQLHRTGFLITPITRDSLKSGFRTQHLNFQ
ncbi:MAG TPA: DUF4249 family protein [Bacteroidetes bacterium]|nr:DUF4249 family protein [Bacteroidota bacterium]